MCQNSERLQHVFVLPLVSAFNRPWLIDPLEELSLNISHIQHPTRTHAKFHSKVKGWFVGICTVQYGVVYSYTVTR